MKFHCLKENLERAIIIAERFTGKNLTLPILSSLLLEVKENILIITATNLEYAIQISVHGTGTSNGKVCIPAKILSIFIQSVRDEKINFEEQKGNLHIKADTRQTKIHGVTVADFPIIPKIKKTSSFLLESNVFQKAIEKVIPAVATSEFKPEFTGVFFNISGKTLHLAATDTFRLAEHSLSLVESPTEKQISFILPFRIAQEFTRVFSEQNELVTVSISENQILFESEGISIISRLIEGSFPEYAVLIPKTFQTTTYIDRQEFITNIRASSIFASKLQDVIFSFKGKNLEINSSNSEIGEFKTVIPSVMSGKDITISFNYHYLLDGLNALDEEEIFLGLNSESAPSLLRNKSDGSFLYVLMPIRQAP